MRRSTVNRLSTYMLLCFDTMLSSSSRRRVPSKRGAMGDKSPKSKKRDQKQKQASKQQVAKAAKSKRDKQGQASVPFKGKK